MRRETKTTLGNLISTFRLKRDEAREKGINDLWKRNKLDNPTKRGGHEIREQSTHSGDGKTTMSISLWKKIDEKIITISANVKADEVTAETEDVSAKDLMA